MRDIRKHFFLEFNFPLEIVNLFDCSYICDTSYDYSSLEKISVFLNRNRKILNSLRSLCLPSLESPS